jgi:hypothetical protein
LLAANSFLFFSFMFFCFFVFCLFLPCPTTLKCNNF